MPDFVKDTSMNTSSELSDSEREYLNSEFTSRKINTKLAWWLWIIGFFLLSGIHVFAFKKHKYSKLYFLLWVLILLTLPLSKIACIIVSSVLTILWIIDGIFMNNYITQVNSEIEQDILNEIKNGKLNA